MRTIVEHPVLHWTPNGNTASEIHCLIAEAPLSVYVQDRPVTAGMRTPGNEQAQAAGYCLFRGLVSQKSDIADIRWSPEIPDEVRVTLTPERWRIASEILQQRESVESNVGRGVSAVMAAICRETPPFSLPQTPSISAVDGFQSLEELADHQPLREITRATHATAIYSHQFERLAVSEDVGRHNGMDKAIGTLLLNDKLTSAGVMTLSSRISFELVVKAARAGISTIFSISLPSALAVHLGERLNMTLCSLSRKGGGMIYCGPERLIF